MPPQEAGALPLPELLLSSEQVLLGLEQSSASLQYCNAVLMGRTCSGAPVLL